MDFFQAQERARRNTKWLVLLFILALLSIILAVYLLFLFTISDATPGQGLLARLWQPGLLLGVAAGVTALVFGGSLYKVAQLASGGGVAVAESLGARPVERATSDLLERRLLNVVDEMAIASGLTVPQVYVMDEEAGINAFAAGTSPNEAVVAVTRGCLEQLSRDELQGVVAHEFSHIFNGDMRLNLRLIGILHGILLIALIGRGLMRASSETRVRSNSKNQGGIVLFGLLLFVIGYIGVFFGKLIKAAVSRQREFLADAAAVQFTRNPQGISGALQKIAGIDATRMQTPRAEEASHMLFGQGVSSLFGLLATHPPIEERIARIEPALRASLAGAARAAPVVGESEGHETAMGFAGRLSVTPGGVRGSIGTIDAGHLAYAHAVLERLPEAVREDLKLPRGAQTLLYALLVVDAPDPETVLRAALGDEQDAAILRSLDHLPWLREAGRELWLPLLELALPALRELPPDACAGVLAQADALTRADGKLSLFEFTLLSLLNHQLGERRTAPARTTDLAAIRGDTALLLSLLAHAGHSDITEAQKAFDVACARVPLDGPWTLFERQALKLDALEPALAHLGGLKFAFKGKLIEACVAAIAADGHVSVAEAELLRAIGARLDCPVPPLVAGEMPVLAN